MIFQLSESFSSIFKKKIQIDIAQTLPLRRLIEKLPGELFEFVPDWREAADDQLSAHILFIRNGHLMKLDDPVDNGDKIKMMLPMTGG